MNIPPSFLCIMCFKGVPANCLAVSCDVCDKWCHIHCATHITRPEYHEMARSEECRPCVLNGELLDAMISCMHYYTMQPTYYFFVSAWWLCHCSPRSIYSPSSPIWKRQAHHAPSVASLPITRASGWKIVFCSIPPWSVLNIAVRTNNDVEGLHNRFNNSHQ